MDSENTSQFYIDQAIPVPESELGGDAPDYYPLNRSEIARLLRLARKHQDNCRQVSSVQVRLAQGTPGKTVSVESESPVSQKIALLNAIFMKEYKNGADPELIDRIQRILEEE